MSWLRVFVALMLAMIPPIFVLAAVALATDTLLSFLTRDLLAISVLAAVITWPAVLAVVYSRLIADDYRSLLSEASRGGSQPDTELNAAAGQLATALEERNRQVAALARESSRLPIEDEPRLIADAVVKTAQSVTGDATWRLTVLSTELETLLPRGTYDGEVRTGAGDMEQWAAMQAAGSSAVRAEGPWGAFVVVGVSPREHIRAVLYAPWEGRPAPTPAEIDLLTLVGQQAGTALEHSLLYARVRLQAEELQRLAAVQADFLRGVTHDLQTPLTSIGVLASELHASEGVPDSTKQDLALIGNQADRLRRIVKQLLVASRLEAGAFSPQIDVFNVLPVVERTWTALRADRPFSLTSEGPSHLAVADADRVEQVLWAVFDNAVKYSPRGSPVETTIAAGTRTLSITVRDHGVGMDPETRRRAFDQFYRSEQARKLAPDGSGVGLYAARGLMEAMGGELFIESSLGAGTSVTLVIPAEPTGGE